MSIADNIHVLEGGEIVASGEYSKLMEMSKNSDSVRIALLQSVAKKESFY
jgi:ABC-type glutathione transport system ATPase component